MVMLSTTWEDLHNMIQPSNVLCSVQKITQHIHKLSNDPNHLDPNDGSIFLPELIPKRLREELEVDASELRSYRTDVHFTVESNGVKGVLQMDGYTIPNPTVENRYSIWFIGGRCYALNAKDKDTRQKWRDVFGTELKLKKRERFQLWMAKLMMGAEPSSGMLEDDSLQYVMKKPIGGHNVAYQQVCTWMMKQGSQRAIEGQLLSCPEFECIYQNSFKV